MTRKQRVKTLALGTFCVSMNVLMFSVWFLAQLNPDGKMVMDANYLFLPLFLWGGLYFTMLPFIPNDQDTPS